MIDAVAPTPPPSPVKKHFNMFQSILTSILFFLICRNLMSFYVKIIKSINFVYITVCLQRGMNQTSMRYILPLILPVKHTVIRLKMVFQLLPSIIIYIAGLEQ